MRCVNIQVRTMPKAGTGMRSSAVAAHLADAQRTHDRSTVSRSAANDLNVGGIPAELLRLASQRKDGIETGGKYCHSTFRVFLPRAAKNFGCKNNGGRSGVRIGLRRVAILW